jgi:peptidoglycan/xylan/chitin deacetylase (PgdA/CDA1 family)
MGVPILVLLIGLSGCLVPGQTANQEDDPIAGPDDDSDLTGIRVSSFFNMGSGKEWVKIYGNGSLADQQSPVIKLPASMLLTARENGSTIIEKILAPPLNLCDEPNISIKISAPSLGNISSLAGLNMSLIGGTDYTNNASYNLGHFNRELYLMPTQRWVRINMAYPSLKFGTDYDCSKVSRIRLALYAPQAAPDTLSLGKLSFYPNPLDRAVLLITEDDQWTDFETNGLPAMRKHGFPGTIYANAGLVGTGTKMSLESLKNLQDSAGWTIANHMWLHDSITTLSNDSAAKSIRRNSEFLKAAGFTGYTHFAYPYGLADREKDSVVRSTCASARLTLGWGEGEPIPFSDPYRLHTIGFLDNTVTLDMAKEALQQLAGFRTAGILGVHEIVTEGALDSRKWLRSDWEALLDYIRLLVDQGQLSVYSLEEFYAKYHPGPL